VLVGKSGHAEQARVWRAYCVVDFFMEDEGCCIGNRSRFLQRMETVRRGNLGHRLVWGTRGVARTLTEEGRVEVKTQDTIQWNYYNRTIPGM